MNTNIEKGDNNEVQKTSDPISFFEKDDVFVYVYKKTEKLATALYMVTNLFSESEPMKWALRKKVGDLLSFMVGYKDILAVEHADFSRTIRSRVLEIVSLLDVSAKSGLVSNMNFGILKQEFSNLLTHIDDLSASHHAEKNQHTIHRDFFNVPQRQNTLGNQGQIDTHGTPVNSTNVSLNNFQNNNQNVLKKNNRQNIIIGLLKKKKVLTIKDIAQTIRDCSEKTIQRELSALIVSGVLKKTGERRWSKYSLVAEN